MPTKPVDVDDLMRAAKQLDREGSIALREYMDGVRSERAKIVSWLRQMRRDCDHVGIPGGPLMDEIADRIMREEHYD